MNILKQNNTRERLLRNVQEASFCVDEARLYLDTHPDDENAKRYFDKYNDMRHKAMQSFEQYYGALLTDDIDAVRGGWTWVNEPFPWDEEVK